MNYTMQFLQTVIPLMFRVLAVQNLKIGPHVAQNVIVNYTL